MANKVGLKKVVEKMNLKNLTPDVDLTEKKVEVPDINRPALQLTGFFEHFDSERVQIIGYVEYTFLETMDEKTKEETYETLLSYQIPVSYTHLTQNMGIQQICDEEMNDDANYPGLKEYGLDYALTVTRADGSVEDPAPCHRHF